MGKTTLVPSLTYFTKEEYEERKILAKKAGLSVSNFNRISMKYPTFKQGKPKGKKAKEDHLENSISFGGSLRSDENFQDPKVVSEIVTEKLADFVLTEMDVEDIFANIFTEKENSVANDNSIKKEFETNNRVKFSDSDN